MEANELTPLQWHTEYRALSELKPLEKNPFGILTPEKRARLLGKLVRLGVFEVATVDSDNNLLTFNKRYYLLSTNHPADHRIEVMVPNRPLTDQERKEIIIASNVHEGEWDLDLLKEDYEMVDLEALGLDLQALGLDALSLQEPEEEQEFDAEPPVIPITAPGDLYEFTSPSKGLQHRLHCADSTDSDAVARTVNGRQVDAVITDPPYNVNYSGKTKKALKIENDSMSNDSFYQFLYDLYLACFLITRPGGPIYVFHADSEGANFRQALKDSGFKLSQCLVWVKQTMVMGRQDYHWKHEPILYGWKEGAAHPWYSDRKQTTVLNFDRPSRNADHPTMKPVEIISYLVENSTRPGETVFDPCSGSGSLTISCEQLLRNYYGQELGPEYCDVIVRRWVKYMRDNGLPYQVSRNGILLDEHELTRYFPA